MHLNFKCKLNGDKWFHTGKIPSKDSSDFVVDEVWQRISLSPSPTKSANAIDLIGFGMTELMSAKTGDEIKTLFAEGADLNLKDNVAGKTALMCAADNDRPDCVRALIEAGADVSVKDNVGNSALHYAKSDNVASILRAAGAKE